MGPIAVVIQHRMIQRGGVALSNKSVYWDSPEVARKMDSTKEKTCTISWEKESHCSKEH